MWLYAHVGNQSHTGLTLAAAFQEVLESYEIEDKVSKAQYTGRQGLTYVS